MLSKDDTKFDPCSYDDDSDRRMTNIAPIHEEASACRIVSIVSTISTEVDYRVYIPTKRLSFDQLALDAGSSVLASWLSDNLFAAKTAIQSMHYKSYCACLERG